MNSFFQINCYQIISLSYFSPILSFCLDFRVDMVSCMRSSFFIFYFLSSLTLLPPQFFYLHDNIFNAILVFFYLHDNIFNAMKSVELEDWDSSYACSQALERLPKKNDNKLHLLLILNS